MNSKWQRLLDKVRGRELPRPRVHNGPVAVIVEERDIARKNRVDTIAWFEVISDGDAPEPERVDYTLVGDIYAEFDRRIFYRVQLDDRSAVVQYWSHLGEVAVCIDIRWDPVNGDPTWLPFV